MKDSALACRDEQRREAVRKASALHGLDYVEVELFDEHGDPKPHPTLRVQFLGKAPSPIRPENIRIEGGRRIRDIWVVGLQVHHQDDPELDDCMTITVDRPGDLSTYTLCLVELDERGQPIVAGESHDRRKYRPLHGLDPRYACLEFSFTAGCPSELDCKSEAICPPAERVEPEINYLAKDYASFRQLILDRLALIMPDWQERHIPDVGIALVEVLAYVGDYLSYYQDAVATEAYLETARQRISVRRHVRLVDYPMHEGCNARTWVCVWTSQDAPPLNPKETYFITGCPELAQAPGKVLRSDDLRNIPPSRYEVFEPLLDKADQTIQLYAAHSEIRFYTWGNRECCLPRGATSATLLDKWLLAGEPRPPAPSIQPSAQPSTRERALHLKVGDILVFEEVKGPKTGNPADADPSHRQAVRLTRVEPGEDPLLVQAIPGSEEKLPTPIVEIEWAAEDALRFPLCISATGQAPQCDYLENVSVACGNVILVDHGQTIEEPLGSVPKEATIANCESECQPAESSTVPGHFRPGLQKKPLTFSQPLPASAPASSLLSQDPRQAMPQIRLRGIPPNSDGSDSLFQPEDLSDPTTLARRLGAASSPDSQYLRGRLSSETLKLLNEYDGASALPAALSSTLLDELNQLLSKWIVQPDLLSSRSDDKHFVVEMDNDGDGHLRFGDGDLGRMPEAGTTFLAAYRVGNGPSGNVGAEAISYIVFGKTAISGISLRLRNPLPAQGGTAPESLAEIKLLAPHTFRKELQRAITADDYAHVAERNPKLQRAAATLRWTGSWYEVLVAIDPKGTEEADQALLREIKEHLHRYRRMGHNLVVAPAHYVSLDIAMIVCVLPHYLRGHVEAALLDVFSNRLLPDGRRGFFHPDNLTFGEGVYLSKLVATAQAVPGVESVVVTQLERFLEGPNHEIENGILPLGPREIAQLDNDPSFPEHGKLELDVRGGR